MTVMMMVFLIYVAALAIDLGRYSVVKSRIQNTADMAAVAGATAYDYQVLYDTGVNKLDAARAIDRATRYWTLNKTAGFMLESIHVYVVGADGYCRTSCVGQDGVVYYEPTVLVEVTGTAGVPVFGKILGASSYDVHLWSAASLTTRYSTGTSPA